MYVRYTEYVSENVSGNLYKFVLRKFGCFCHLSGNNFCRTPHGFHITSVSCSGRPDLAADVTTSELQKCSCCRWRTNNKHRQFREARI